MSSSPYCAGSAEIVCEAECRTLERNVVIKRKLANGSSPGEEPKSLPGGGGYSHTLPVRVCAAQRGRDFEAPDLERGIHFRGVF